MLMEGWHQELATEIVLRDGMEKKADPTEQGTLLVGLWEKE